jgi:hypothetical protein
MHVLDMKRVGVYTVQLSLPDFAHPGRSLENRIHASDTLGIRGIVEHALSDSARAFYLALGFKQSPGQPLTRTITVKELQAALVP